MIRVLMTADAVGGVWTYTCELAGALAAHGVATTIATMGPAPTSDQLAGARDIPGLDIVTSRYQLEWMNDPWQDVEAAGRWLVELERRIDPWVVHLNGYAHGAVPFRRPVVVVGHSCVLSWRDGTGGTIAPDWLSRYHTIVERGIRAADWVVAPTATMLESLQRHYGPLAHASVVFNGRDAERFPPGAKEPLVFSAGRLWDRAKNVDAVVDAAPMLGWPVAVAGQGSAVGQVRHLGRLSEREIASWLRRSSIFAHPARYEPFGLLPVEAGLAGCALVLGDIPSLREVWDDAALFVPPDNREAIVDAIERLRTSDTLLTTFAARARARALTYTPERMALGYLKVYECVAGRPRSFGDAVRTDASGTGTEALRCAS